MAIQQPRPLLMMGKAQTVPLRERSLRDQVEAQLVRMRHTLPFPCTLDEAYFGCVPAAVKEWDRARLFEGDPPLPGKTSNLLATMYALPVSQQTARPNILHVCVQDADEYLGAQQGQHGYEGIFWFDAPSHVPLPRNSKASPFYLPDDHPYHDQINDWVEQAFIIEDEIQTSLELMTRYQACACTATQVANTWPELLHFVSAPRSGGALSRQVSKALREQAAKVMRPTDKEALLTQLARAVMLPETRPPLQAWVKFYTPEIGT